MQTHVKVLGILHVVFGALGILAALGIMALFGSIAGLIGFSADRDAAVAAPIVGMVGSAIMIVILVLSIPGMVIGWGIMNFKPWARTWGIVISAFDLIQVPLGTILGIYGLWVLLSAEGTALFTGQPLPAPAWQPPPQPWGQQNPPGPRNPT